MILIAHRGLIEGPDPSKENNPQHIKQLIDQGFNCEVDVWLIGTDFFLGHDTPQYKINEEFLLTSHLWIHAKNKELLFHLREKFSFLNYFWHESDTYTITSRGIIWAHSGQIVEKNSIQVMPEYTDKTLNNLNFNCYGICSDYILQIQKIMELVGVEPTS